MIKSFAEIRRAAPNIHVFIPFEQNGVTMLRPGDLDERYENRPYSEGYIEGNGTQEKPYTYKSAAPVSAHYAAIDLWFRFRHCNRPVFIKINDWLLQVNSDGVTAADNHFTKLIRANKM